MLLSTSSRIGECGSGIWSDKQGAAYEFSNLETVTFRGKSLYHLPINNSVASFNLTGQDGTSTVAPIYGQFNMYIDQRLRSLVSVSPNARYQLRWLDNYTKAHGNSINVGLTYGSLNANFKINVRGVAGALDRL
ncbi:MAG: hypothetical protein U0V87_01625 [Acidobacteriota bacterium]